MPDDDFNPEQAIEHFVDTFAKLKEEIGKFIVGQQEIVEHVLVATLCGGHVLLEGVPGLGKTALVTTMSQALHLRFRRIQFTPDLLPADIVGSNLLVERSGAKAFEFQEGPVFCHILLADEINRATPKTQSALLETMQEKSVTVAGETHPLPSPFFVLATQNPIEHDGTYPLPEAQLDRFFFKLHISSPSHEEVAEILRRTGGNTAPTIEAVASGEDVLRMGRTLRTIPIEDSVQDHLIRIVRATHPDSDEAPEQVKKYVRIGASPRGAQTILSASRAHALLRRRYHVAREDIDAVALPSLRHRLILSFEGEAEGISCDDLLRSVIEDVRGSPIGSAS